MSKKTFFFIIAFSFILLAVFAFSPKEVCASGNCPSGFPPKKIEGKGCAMTGAKNYECPTGLQKYLAYAGSGFVHMAVLTDETKKKVQEKSIERCNTDLQNKMLQKSEECRRICSGDGSTSQKSCGSNFLMTQREECKATCDTFSVELPFRRLGLVSLLRTYKCTAKGSLSVRCDCGEVKKMIDECGQENCVKEEVEE